MLEKMKEIIADQLSVDADSITEASSFKEDLGADSLDLFRCFQDIVCRDDMPLQCVMMDLFIKCHVTVFVLLTAAAPAHVISSQFFHISSVPGLLTGLIQ